MARALITGIAGQDGSYLAERLIADGYDVVGFDLPASAAEARNLGGIADQIEYISGDLLEVGSLRSAIAASGADEIYHLAAPTFVPDSWEDPSSTMAAIVGSTSEVLAAALEASARPKVWFSASAEVFGDTDVSPQNEDSAMRPRSPYGVAKLAALGLVRTMREHHGLFACGGILYNHESPRRPPHFLPRKVTRGAAAIALGQQDELVLGDLTAVRDWSDARDIVGAIVLAVRAEQPSDYVLASGQGRTVGELVEAAFAAAGISDRVEDSIRVDPAFVRPPESIAPIGDPSRAEQELGWKRAFSFEQMIAEMVEADLADLRSSS
ncbi:MAG: GDP-mannose 4,6-dehydratase [Actinomycetes bacterium]